MDLSAQLDLGELRLWTLLPDDADRLVAAVGLMLDSPHGAELAYWVRPEQRRLPRHCRAWLEDDPARDQWHDCLILAHTLHGLRRSLHTGVD